MEQLVLVWKGLDPVTLQTRFPSHVICQANPMGARGGGNNPEIPVLRSRALATKSLIKFTGRKSWQQQHLPYSPRETSRFISSNHPYSSSRKPAASYYLRFSDRTRARARLIRVGLKVRARERWLSRARRLLGSMSTRVLLERWDLHRDSRAR